MTGQAVHFGAGSIGRGFLGQIYCESGYHTAFIDVVEPVVHAINLRGGYPLHIVSDEGDETIHINNVSAVSGADAGAASAVLAKADIASTAVGLYALRHIAPIIAGAVMKRFENGAAAPLDIIICENLKDGEAYMRSLVAKHLPPEMHGCLETRVGFVEASIGRMVPVVTSEQRESDPLAVWVEPYCELPVDARGFRGPIPPLCHLKPAANFEAYVERKLFVHNLTHAATAYFGYRKGYDYICDAIRDGAVRDRVAAAGREACAALAKKHDIDPEVLEAHLQDLLRRYHNRALADQVARVARDPKRKLGPDDRLVGALRLCLEFGLPCGAIASAAAAAILYDAPGDESASALQELLHSGGIRGVLKDICGLHPDSPEGAVIIESVDKLRAETKES